VRALGPRRLIELADRYGLHRIDELLSNWIDRQQLGG
jgi:hypothetical protein